MLPVMSTIMFPSLNGNNSFVSTICVGFYRVLYDNALNDLIDAELDRNPEAFTPITRAQIVDDRLNLGIAGSCRLSRLSAFSWGLA